MSAVCKKCGWYESYSGHLCAPARGRAVDRLVERAREHVDVKATKLGYGEHRVSFQLSKTCTLTLMAHEAGTFGVDRLHWLDDLDDDEVTQLVCVLAVMVEKKRKKEPKAR